MSNVKFFAVVGKRVQQAFRDDGALYDFEVDEFVGEQHILYQEVIMCGASRSTLKNKHQSKKHSIRLNSFKNVPLCEKCERKFKMNSNLPWRKWEEKAGITDDKITMEVK